MICRPEVVPPVTQELKGTTSAFGISHQGQPKFPTSGTLSQTMTIKTTGKCQLTVKISVKTTEKK